MVKSQMFSDIYKAYINIFPNKNDNFEKVLAKAECTAYDDIAILAVSWDSGVMFINSCSKDDIDFPFLMLKDIIRLAKQNDKVCLSTTRKDEIRRLALQLGAREIDIGFIKGVG